MPPIWRAALLAVAVAAVGGLCLVGAIGGREGRASATGESGDARRAAGADRARQDAARGAVRAWPRALVEDGGRGGDGGDVEQQKLETAMASGLRVVVDLAFVDQQSAREQQSVFKQLGCFYGYLKQCPLDALVSLRVASCGTPRAAELCKQHGLVSWKIWRHEDPVEKIYSANQLVVLSPDAEEVLDTLDPSYVYVVGGHCRPNRSQGRDGQECRARRNTHCSLTNAAQRNGQPSQLAESVGSSRAKSYRESSKKEATENTSIMQFTNAFIKTEKAIVPSF